MKKKIFKLGIIFGALFIVIGLMSIVPNQRIYNPKAYVGGDAYNYIIESSLRGGVIAGKIVKRALYICTGIIISFISLIKLTEKTENDTDLIKNIESNDDLVKKIENNIDINK